MKVVQPRTQFDRPESIATPATPSCCCCCCCLATIVSSTTMGAITAHHQAKRVNRQSGWPTLLALLAVPVGFVAFGTFASAGGEAVVALIVGSVVALVLWYFAFHLAAPESESSPVGRSFKYLGLFGACFAVELFLGIFLVIFYVIPYLIVAGLVIYSTIASHLKSQRSELRLATLPPPAWTSPTPPTSGVSPYEPPSPVFESPPPPAGNPTFEPPTNYQLPGFPAAPPQADGPPPSPGTYRPGNPATQSPQPPISGPTEEQS